MMNEDESRSDCLVSTIVNGEEDGGTAERKRDGASNQGVDHVDNLVESRVVGVGIGGSVASGSGINSGSAAHGALVVVSEEELVVATSANGVDDVAGASERIDFGEPSRVFLSANRAFVAFLILQSVARSAHVDC